MGFKTNPLNKSTKKKWKYSWLKHATDPKRVLGTNRFLGSRYMVGVWVFLYTLFLFIIGNYIFNFFYELKNYLKFQDPIYYGLKAFFPNFQLIGSLDGGRKFYLVFFLVILIFDAIFVYKIRVNYSDEFFNVKQKGDARWTTREEIEDQYRKIPMDGTEYEGNPGTIVYRYKKNLYIDRGNTNNLIVGMTRSGKGEMYVFNSIDIQSRSKEKPSLVINDPKKELYKSSKKILEERGYDCFMLNLNNPLHSMGYNELKIIIDAYKRKDYSNAELLAQTFAYSIFNPDDAPGETAFFAKTAASLFCALIIAHIEDCIGEDERINEKRLKLWKKKRLIFDRLSKSDQEELRREFTSLIQGMEDPITNSKCWCLIEDFSFYETHKEEEKINVYSIINTFTELASVQLMDSPKTLLDVYFETRPALNRAKLKYASVGVAGNRTKGSIFADMLAKVGIFTFENIAKMSAESSFDLEDLGYGDRPIAVFLSPPDYDASNHFLATVFIRQMYFILAQKASNSRSGRTKRLVKCILDEFGNMPSIENMGNIVTVCLGRGISFDMYIQSYTQLNERYGDMVAKIIEGNCGNQIYILTSDEDTTSKFSSLIGEETIVTIQRSGSRHSLDKTITEMVEAKPLLNKNQLMELLEGECVIRRTMQRTNLIGEPVRPTPIFCSREEGSYLEYRYRDSYLSKLFPDPSEIDLEEVLTEDRSYINLEERVWDPKQSLRLLEVPPEEVKRVRSLEEEKKQAVLDWLQEEKIVETIREMEEMTLSHLVEEIYKRPGERSLEILKMVA